MEYIKGCGEADFMKTCEKIEASVADGSFMGLSIIDLAAMMSERSTRGKLYFDKII